MSYEEEIKFNTDFLDTLDLDPPKQWEEVDDWVTRMEDKFEYLNVKTPAELQGEIFGFMDSWDIGKYVTKRFGGQLKSVEKIYFVGCREND